MFIVGTSKMGNFVLDADLKYLYNDTNYHKKIQINQDFLKLFVYNHSFWGPKRKLKWDIKLVKFELSTVLLWKKSYYTNHMLLLKIQNLTLIQSILYGENNYLAI